MCLIDLCFELIVHFCNGILHGQMIFGCIGDRSFSDIPNFSKTKTNQLVSYSFI